MDNLLPRLKFLPFWAIILTACSIPNAAAIPDRDIVFQANEFETPGIGFINADGTGLTILDSVYYVYQPVWVNRDQIVFYEVRGGYGATTIARGTPVFWESDKPMKKCSNFLGINSAVIPDDAQGEFWVLTFGSSIKRITFPGLFGNCSEIATLLSGRLDGNDNQYHSITYSSAQDLLVYTKITNRRSDMALPQLFLVDVETGGETLLGEGFAPSISHDGTQLAFLRGDGLYVTRLDSFHNFQKLVEMELFEDYTIFTKDEPLPVPQWSPDDSKIAYHRCGFGWQGCTETGEYSIYIYDFSSGLTTKLLDGGLYPYWQPTH